VPTFACALLKVGTLRFAHPTKSRFAKLLSTVIASEAKQSSFAAAKKAGLLRPSLLLAMTWKDMRSHSRGAFSPGFCKFVAPSL
jgi:hypothetical protein